MRKSVVPLLSISLVLALLAENLPAAVFHPGAVANGQSRLSVFFEAQALQSRLAQFPNPVNPHSVAAQIYEKEAKTRQGPALSNLAGPPHFYRDAKNFRTSGLENAESAAILIERRNQKISRELTPNPQKNTAIRVDWEPALEPENHLGVGRDGWVIHLHLWGAQRSSHGLLVHLTAEGLPDRTRPILAENLQFSPFAPLEKLNVDQTEWLFQEVEKRVQAARPQLIGAMRNPQFKPMFVVRSIEENGKATGLFRMGNLIAARTTRPIRQSTYRVAIQYGGVLEEEVNEGISRAIETAEPAEHEPILAASRLLDQPKSRLTRWMFQGLSATLATSRIVVVPGEFLFRDPTRPGRFQPLHVGLARRTIYISEGLWKLIKDTPALLAAALAHELMHLYQRRLSLLSRKPYIGFIFGWIGERWAVLVERRLDPGRGLRRVILNGLAAQPSDQKPSRPGTHIPRRVMDFIDPSIAPPGWSVSMTKPDYQDPTSLYHNLNLPADWILYETTLSPIVSSAADKMTFSGAYNPSKKEYVIVRVNNREKFPLVTLPSGGSVKPFKLPGLLYAGLMQLKEMELLSLPVETIRLYCVTNLEAIRELAVASHGAKPSAVNIDQVSLLRMVNTLAVLSGRQSDARVQIEGGKFLPVAFMDRTDKPIRTDKHLRQAYPEAAAAGLSLKSRALRGFDAIVRTPLATEQTPEVLLMPPDPTERLGRDEKRAIKAFSLVVEGEERWEAGTARAAATNLLRDLRPSAERDHSLSAEDIRRYLKPSEETYPYRDYWELRNLFERDLQKWPAALAAFQNGMHGLRGHEKELPQIAKALALRETVRQGTLEALTDHAMSEQELNSPWLWSLLLRLAPQYVMARHVDILLRALWGELQMSQKFEGQSAVARALIRMAGWGSPWIGKTQAHRILGALRARYNVDGRHPDPALPQLLRFYDPRSDIAHLEKMWDYSPGPAQDPVPDSVHRTLLIEVEKPARQDVVIHVPFRRAADAARDDMESNMFVAKFNGEERYLVKYSLSDGQFHGPLFIIGLTPDPIQLKNPFVTEFLLALFNQAQEGKKSASPSLNLFVEVDYYRDRIVAILDHSIRFQFRRGAPWKIQWDYLNSGKEIFVHDIRDRQAWATHWKVNDRMSAALSPLVLDHTLTDWGDAENFMLSTPPPGESAIPRKSAIEGKGTPAKHSPDILSRDA